MSNIHLVFDQQGSGTFWGVVIDNTLVWSHNAIEGPVPDAIDVWNHIAKYVPVLKNGEWTDGNQS